MFKKETLLFIMIALGLSTSAGLRNWNATRPKVAIHSRRED